MPVQKLQLKLNIRKFLKLITRNQKKKIAAKPNLAKIITMKIIVMANAKTALVDVATHHSAFSYQLS